MHEFNCQRNVKSLSLPLNFVPKKKQKKKKQNKTKKTKEK